MVKIFSKNNIWWQRRILFVVNFALLVIFWTWLFIKINYSQDIIPLHYNIYYGIDWFGPSYYMYLYTLLGTIWFLSNTLLAFFWFKNNKKIFYFLSIYSLLLNIFLLFGIFLIILFYFNPS